MLGVAVMAACQFVFVINPKLMNVLHENFYKRAVSG